MKRRGWIADEVIGTLTDGRVRAVVSNYPNMNVEPPQVGDLVISAYGKKRVVIESATSIIGRKHPQSGVLMAAWNVVGPLE